MSWSGSYVMFGRQH